MTPRRPWVVWGLGVCAYAVAVFQRASLGVAGVEAQRRFGASAAALSLFSVLQLGVYAGLQVPVGVLLDRVGSRRLIVAGATVMASGQLVLALAHSVGLAVVGRVLVGAGDAMTFISVLRLVALWFAAERVALVTQLTGILGQFGQLAAALPLVALLHGAGWTATFVSAAVIGVVVAVASGVGIRDARPGAAPAGPSATPREALADLGHAWRNLGTRLGLWTHFVCQFSGIVFALLWGYPFLVVGEGRTPGEAALLLTILVLVGMGVGPALGQFAGRWPYRRSISTLTIVLSTAGAWSLVLLWPGRAPLALLVALVVVLGSNGPGSLMGFDYARTENEAERIGSANGIVNVGGFAASLTTILLIGLVLDLRAPGGPATYTLGDFKLAMCVQYAFWAVGLAGVLVTRRRLRSHLGVELDPFHRAVVRVSRRRRGR